MSIILTTYTHHAQHDRPVTRFLEERESARSTIPVLRYGKATSLRVYCDDAGHYYVRTGKRGATKELVVGHTKILPGRYSFTIKPQWEIDNEWLEERREAEEALNACATCDGDGEIENPDWWIGSAPTVDCPDCYE